MDAHGTQAHPQPDLTAEQAQQMLDRAGRVARKLPSGTPAVLITYAGLCAVGTFTTIGLHLVELIPAAPGVDPKLLVLIMAFAWVAVSLIPIWIFRDRWRRGLGVRWGVYIGLWALFWVAGVVLATTTMAIFLAPAFLVLFVVAITQEAARARQDQGAERTAGGERR
ncbi:hypothetical protein BRM3_00515 [Brachybacterium huguangmaarense]|uniref:Uncharacterized protein n=1 Tax=Brachybacterium huguangmaarense TaxID=1652028 RepID=A0ABY6G186_9MICO|nr:hypothetical protein [Brachybacterium huguangmaarense]UYG16958.1 hypothetical protein BRM3_00515 [Brachybacterium huguangmaarense]